MKPNGWFIVVRSLSLALACASAAHAEEKARLVYVRGEGIDGCPSEVDLRLWVMARLGYDPFSPQASRVVLSRIQERDEQLVGSLEIVDQSGVSTGLRELSTKPGRCPELARALALSISLAIDPERASQPRPQVTSDAPAPQGSPPEPASPAPAAAEPPAARRQRAPLEPPRRAFASLAFEPSVGALPAFALGASAAIGLRFGSASLALEGLLSRSLSRSLSPRGKLDGWLAGGGLSGCWTPQGWDVCGVGVLGAERLSTSGVTAPSADTGVFVGLGPRVARSAALGGGVELWLALQGLLNLTRNGAEFSGQEVWRTPAITGTLQLGLRARFL